MEAMESRFFISLVAAALSLILAKTEREPFGL